MFEAATVQDSRPVSKKASWLTVWGVGFRHRILYRKYAMDRAKILRRDACPSGFLRPIPTSEPKLLLLFQGLPRSSKTPYLRSTT